MQITENIKDVIKLVEENEAVAKVMEKKGEEILESLFASMQMRSREAKINAAVGAIAVALAKQKNDPLYHKLKKFRALWKKTKDEIIKKYGNIAYQKWVQKQASK
jgi:hypothetical protein